MLCVCNDKASRSTEYLIEIFTTFLCIDDVRKDLQLFKSRIYFSNVYITKLTSILRNTVKSTIYGSNLLCISH